VPHGKIKHQRQQPSVGRVDDRAAWTANARSALTLPCRDDRPIVGSTIEDLTMRRCLVCGVSAAVALIAMIDVAHARAAGTKPVATTLAVGDYAYAAELAGKKSEPTDRHVARSIKRPTVHHRTSDQ
jgi:hypothetical protein